MESYGVTYIRAFVGGDWVDLGVPAGTRLEVTPPGDGSYRPGEPSDHRGRWGITQRVTVGPKIADRTSYEVEIGSSEGECWRGTAGFAILPLGLADLYPAGGLAPC